MIKAVEFGAAPAIRDPTSNSPNAVMKIHLGLKRLYNLPKGSWNATYHISICSKRYDKDIPHVVRRYADPYHPTSCNAWKSSVILGIAVAIIVLSSATQNTAVHKAKMQSARGVPDKCAAPIVFSSFMGASSGGSSGFSVNDRVSGVDIWGNIQRRDKK